jgi:hypothetical protein
MLSMFVSDAHQPVGVPLMGNGRLERISPVSPGNESMVIPPPTATSPGSQWAQESPTPPPGGITPTLYERTTALVAPFAPGDPVGPGTP